MVARHSRDIVLILKLMGTSAYILHPEHSTMDPCLLSWLMCTTCCRVAESIRRIIELGNQLTKGLSNLLDHQSYMRQREDAHAEST